MAKSHVPINYHSQSREACSTQPLSFNAGKINQFLVVYFFSTFILTSTKDGKGKPCHLPHMKENTLKRDCGKAYGLLCIDYLVPKHIDYLKDNMGLGPRPLFFFFQTLQTNQDPSKIFFILLLICSY